MISQACKFVQSAIEAEQFIVICEDRAMLYSCEADSENDDGAKALETFCYSAYQIDSDGLAEICIDLGADYFQV